MNLKRAYYFLFYRFYKMSEAAPSRWLSDWKAGVVIIVLEVYLFMALVNYYNIFIDRHFFLSRGAAVVGTLIICGINYFFFIYRDGWKDYVDEFDQLPRMKNRIGSWMVFGLVALIFGAFIFSIYLKTQIDWK